MATLSLRREHFRATSLSSHPRKAPKNQNHAHLPSQAKRRLLARAMGKLLNRGAAMGFGTWVDMAAEACSAASSSRGRWASC